MHNSFRPSCFIVKDRAAKRLSWASRRSTYFRRIVLEMIKEQVDPMTEAEARMAQPSHTPYTKPAVVPHVEYPIMGGNAVIKVNSHKIVQPPVVFFHFSAKGSSQPKIFSLKTRNRIPSVASNMRAIPAMTLCNGVMLLTVLYTRF